MRNISALMIAAASIMAAFTISSCDDSATTVGTSLVTDQVEIIIDSTFVLEGQTVLTGAVQARTTDQLLGCIDAGSYGTLRSDVVCQFLPAINIDTTILKLDNIDSVKLLMMFPTGAFTGDSLVPMGLEIYRLNRALPSPIYSNFDPSGYYDPTPIASGVYNATALYNDSVNELSFRTISIKLPLSLGRELYSAYLKNPATFNTPETFTPIFPGFYIRSSFGSGRIVNVMDTRINFHYHATVAIEDEETSVKTDTTFIASRSMLAVSPEVINNNNISYSPGAELQAMAQAGDALIVGPIGSEVSITFPAREVISTFRQQGGNLAVLNTLSLNIPVDSIANQYGIQPPQNLLMVLAKDKAKFFEKNQLTDDTYSFLSKYNSDNCSYTFSGLRSYILDLMNNPNITPDDYTFLLVPVELVTETQINNNSYYTMYYGSGTSTTTYTTAIIPYVSTPVMGRLRLSESKIKLTFSKQTL